MALYTYSPDTIFYGLVRFSTTKQADGDSYRRQDTAAEAFSREEGMPYDKSLHEADIRKLGMSAFSGSHIFKGPIRKFIAGIENGTVKPGKAVLLVSEWNRLTRQVSSDALKFVIGLMEMGIGIIDLQDRAYYTLERYNADTGLQLGLSLKISMSHQYSKNLSHNLKAAWEGRRKAARDGKAKPTNACPEWLRAGDDDGDGKLVGSERGLLWKVREDRIAVINRILELSADGLGKVAIAGRFNDAVSPVPAFRGKEGWHASAVQRIVGNMALLGVYQPRNANDEPIGEPIEGHYPKVVDETLFWRAVKGRDDRKPAGQTTSAGRIGKGYPNLLKGLCRCVHCGGGMVAPDKGTKSGRYLVCSNSQRKRCDNHSHHRYAPLEKDLREVLKRVPSDKLAARAGSGISKSAELEAKIAAEQAALTAMTDELEEMARAGFRVPRSFYIRSATIEAEIEKLTAELADEKRPHKSTMRWRALTATPHLRRCSMAWMTR
jgi:DNA invertase Pin-like site-specific DNA recombinase